ncbi:DinB family protein [Brevibacillus laterosporus]|uniref:DinB family protein n=1 Tax=Brevibacillus laterosporus TaxID=1465 RepID=UPI000EAC3114|nr:DinB family protein [Brevibacillus laterosporus]AYK08200.1 DinB family protein [Brevibacillus laterosporus]
MSNVVKLRDELFHQMNVAMKSTILLLQKIKEEDWGYRPALNMRTLHELACHLVAIPEVDLLIMQEKGEDTIRQIEQKYNRLDTAKSLAQEMEQGYLMCISYLLAMSEDEFFNKKTTPFYHEHSASQAHWFTESVTHMFHHRSQLFTYLKLRGYEVSMFDLYVE